MSDRSTWQCSDTMVNERSATSEGSIDSGDTERSDGPDFERYVSYDDGSGTVICDRQNPAAWIRSDRTVGLRQ